VRADAAWPTTTGSHRTVVAVIDSAIALDHPDLAPNVVFATCITVEPGCDLYPVMAHATRVAGVIAAAFGGGHAQPRLENNPLHTQFSWGGAASTAAAVLAPGLCGVGVALMPRSSVSKTSVASGPILPRDLFFPRIPRSP
jgi:subtilisin family serine protease